MKLEEVTFSKDGVIHFSTGDAGGAFTGAYRIHQSILRLGYNSQLFVQRKTRSDKTIIEIGAKNMISLKSKIWNKIKSYSKKQDLSYCFYDRMKYSLSDSYDVIQHLQFEPKIIFIHWVTGFLNTDVIIDLQRKYGSKVYYTFMDTASLTGGCHYSWDCLGYKSDCSNCPAVRYVDRELPRLNLRKKVHFVKTVSAIPTNGNSWMQEKIRSSRVFEGVEIKNLSIGLDSKVFCPGSKRESRARLGLPDDKRYILVAASSLNDPRKGIKYAKQAIAHLRDQANHKLDNIEVLLAGQLGRFNKMHQWALPARWIGSVDGDQALVDLYRSSDIFLSTSVEDAGPMMVSESMLCGTPVASFNVGKACDLITSHVSGFIVHLNDHEALASSLNYFLTLDSESTKSISIEARRSALEQVSLGAQEKNLRSLLADCETSNDKIVTY